MSHNCVIDKPVLNLIPENVNGLRILDCAIGHGFWGHKIRIFKEGYPHLVGIDIWEPHITKQKSLGIYEDLHVGDVRDLPFPDRSFDIVLACEILEHLDKDDATIFFSEIERVASNQIIITSPHGFMKQNTLYGNIHEKHLSEWFPNELRERGYTVSLHDARIMTRIPKFVDTVRRFFFGFDLPLFIVGHKNINDMKKGERKKSVRATKYKMNFLSKLKIHIIAIKRSKSLRFAFYRLLRIINRRISLPNRIFLGEMNLSDEIIFEELLNPSETVVAVDIGANFGLWTLRYSKNYKEVHAFEPNPNTFSILRRNTRKCKNVKLYCCALGEKNGISDFFIHKAPVCDGFVRKRGDFVKTMKIIIKTLDDFNLDADLIKIDTEGYELPILMGAKKTLENKKPQLYIELHEREQEEPICNLLQELGYKYSIFSIRNETQKIIITDYITAGM